MDIKLDFNDISLLQAEISHVLSRDSIDIDYNPLFVAPMDTVVDESNIRLFNDKGINTILPRTALNPDLLKHYHSLYGDTWLSVGLQDFIDKIIIDDIISDKPIKILIDIANGNMASLFYHIKAAKNIYGDKLIIMAGNIANPKTYLEYHKVGVDYVRCGVGGGSACLTSVQTGIHYPMASLVSEIYELSTKINNPPKIVADGGFKNYSDIIKALALGADYVMLGGIFNKALESCADTYFYSNGIIGDKIDQYSDEALNYFNNGHELVKSFRGMSTKTVQKAMGKKITKTSEGITTYNKVEYTLDGWLDNFYSYLKSSMSYCGVNKLSNFIGYPEIIVMTKNSFNRFNK